MNEQERKNWFYALVWPHAAMVRRAAGMLVYDQGMADDVAQETLLKAYRSLSQLEDGTDARAWLMTILRTTRIDHIRRHKRHQAGEVSLDQMVVEPAARETAGEVDKAWQRPEELLELLSDRHLIAAMKELPDEICWTLLLVDVEGMSHDDAARVLEVPPGTIKSRAHRGRAMLKEALAPLVRELWPSAR